MVLTLTQESRMQKLGARSERLARHAANCEALAAAYVRRRGKLPRMIRFDINDLIQGEGMAAQLWDERFDADHYLDSLPIVSQRRYRLI
jgi:hypothetical protein